MDLPSSSPRSLAELQAASAAAREKTPAVVIEALEPSATQVTGIVFPDQISIRTWLRLEKIGSPFTRKITENSDITLLDVAIALYVITADADTVRKTIRAGEDALEDAAEDYIKAIPVSQMGEMVERLSDFIGQQFATAAPMDEPDDGKSGTGGGLPLPSTSAAPATAPEASQP